MIKKPIVLIDGHNAIHRSHHVFSDLQTSSGNRIGALYGFIQILKRAIRLYQDHIAIVLFDGGRSPRRLASFPAYKGNRKPDVGDGKPGYIPVNDQVPLAMTLCSAMGVHNVRIPDVEADDVMAVLSRASLKSVLYSNDRDFLQLVRPGCTQHIPTTKGQDDIVATWENIPEVTTNTKKGVVGLRTPIEYLLFKCIVGDTSDNISGVFRVGGKTASKIFQAFAKTHDPITELSDDALTKLYSFCATADTKREQRIANQWDEFQLAMSLVSLWRMDLITPAEKVQVMNTLTNHHPIYDEATVFALFQEWEFDSELVDEGYISHLMAQRRKVLV